MLSCSHECQIGPYNDGPLCWDGELARWQYGFLQATSVVLVVKYVIRFSGFWTQMMVWQLSTDPVIRLHLVPLKPLRYIMYRMIILHHKVTMYQYASEWCWRVQMPTSPPNWASFVVLIAGHADAVIDFAQLYHSPTIHDDGLQSKGNDLSNDTIDADPWSNSQQSSYDKDQHDFAQSSSDDHHEDLNDNHSHITSARDYRDSESPQRSPNQTEDIRHMDRLQLEPNQPSSQSDAFVDRLQKSRMEWVAKRQQQQPAAIEPQFLPTDWNTSIDTIPSRSVEKQQEFGLAENHHERNKSPVSVSKKASVTELQKRRQEWVAKREACRFKFELDADEIWTDDALGPQTRDAERSQLCEKSEFQPPKERSWDLVSEKQVKQAQSHPQLQQNVKGVRDSAIAEQELCVICLEAPAVAGILHERSVHVCCCRPCATKCYRLTRKCPICRLPMERIITEIFWSAWLCDPWWWKGPTNASQLSDSGLRPCVTCHLKSW